MAAVLVLGLLASRAHAVRLGPGGLVVAPAALTLTRSVTVSLDLVDETNLGASQLGVEVVPEPAGIMRLVEERPPERFTCTPGGRASGRWIFEGVGTGTVRFKVLVQMITCETAQLSNQHFVTSPVTVRPARIDSAISAEPATAAPGELVTWTLRLRNLGDEEVEYPAPRADVDYGGRGEPVIESAGGPESGAAGSPMDGRLRLPPGIEVPVRWRFRAVRPGAARIQLIAAGLVILPSPVRVRLPARLNLSLAPVPGPAAVGRVVVLRGSLGTEGDAGVRELTAGAAWSPEGAARLVSAAVSASRIELDGPRAAMVVELEMLRPGPLMVTVSASGREADSPREVAAPAVTRLIAVQAPPELACVLQPASATVLVGTKSAFRAAVINRSPTATLGLAPIVVLRRGEAEAATFVPLHAGAPGSGSVWFAGGLVPGEAGELEFAVQVTGRGDRGGAWQTAVSNLAWIRAVAPPRFEVWPLADRSFTGLTTTIRFRVRNAGPDPVRIAAASINLGFAGAGSASPRVTPLPLSLAPGGSATLSVSAYLPPVAAPYPVTGGLTFTGTLTGWHLGFQQQVGTRILVRAVPAATAITAVDPPVTFRPVADPFVHMEWSKTIAGDAGLAVTRPDGRPVKVLRPPGAMPRGFHTALWLGDDDAGRPVPPGAYLVRLAGPMPAGAPASSTVAGEPAPAWPMGAEWVRDWALAVAAP